MTAWNFAQIRRAVDAVRERLSRLGEKVAARVSPRWRRVLRRSGLVLALLVVTIAGIGVGLYGGGHRTGNLGPFTATHAVSPSWDGGTSVAIPPLGSLHVASHDGPAA